ncbi:MAG: hypothetical protein [Caudoviricetes sp.]|nr:MAG: hypothetical protein [Caudoviricetes sp.]
MMYATLSDMQQRYQKRSLDLLTKAKTEDAKPDDSLIERALSDACGLVDSYISARYRLPLTVVPQALAQQCCVIAFYYLNDLRATEQTTKRYEDALRWLRDVRDGKIPLGVDEAGAAPDSEDLAQVVSDQLVFSRQQKGFI